MKIYLLTDTHFGHHALVRYCDRPRNFTEMIYSSLSVVPDGAILIHLGDFCIGNEKQHHEEFVKRTDHVKAIWLVRGNHDKRSITWYSNYWDFVGDRIDLNIFGKTIAFTHRPIVGVNYDLNIHGHCHTSIRSNENVHEKQRLIKMEHHYKPISLKKLLRYE